MNRTNGFQRGRRRGRAGRGAPWLKLAAAALAIAALATLGYMLVNLGRHLLLGGAATLADVVGEQAVIVGDEPRPTFEPEETYEDDPTATPEPDDQSEVPVDELPEDMQPLTPAELEEYQHQAG